MRYHKPLKIMESSDGYLQMFPKVLEILIIDYLTPQLYEACRWCFDLLIVYQNIGYLLLDTIPQRELLTYLNIFTQSDYEVARYLLEHYPSDKVDLCYIAFKEGYVNSYPLFIKQPDIILKTSFRAVEH